MTNQLQNVQLTISNCNNIENASISIVKGCLNVKYGPNGLGKTTIAKSIVSQIKNDGTLNELISFKNQGISDAPKPTVIGADQFKSALVFDESYVNQFMFQRDEVVKNSFDIFVKTSEYDATMKEIEELFAGVKKAFADKPEIDQTIKDLSDLRDAFGTPTRTGEIPKSSKIYKAFAAGNNIDNVPVALVPFDVFIKSQDPSKWIGWQIGGKEFFDLAEICPYCSTGLPDESQKETVCAVAKEYDVTVVKHLNTLKAVIKRLGQYFSPSCREQLQTVTSAKVQLTPEELNFLKSLQGDIDTLIGKLNDLRTISYFSLKDVNAIGDKIKQLKISITFIDKLNSEETRNVIDPINTQLEGLIQEVGRLTGSVNKHKAKIERCIRDNQESIDGFLKSAGYKYSVKIVSEDNSYKMKLVHEDGADYIEFASNCLSYGERNAFSLILFMHQVLSQNPDLVILDDPISSFDKNKKFAILHQLFHGKASLNGRTTIVLTHDIEPAIDVIKSVPTAFQNQGVKPSAFFLSSRGGVVSESPIVTNDIQTFAQICQENVTILADPILKSIYLRRHHEIVDDFGLVYNLLASLFHKRAVPTIKGTDGKQRDMTAEEKANAEQLVHTDIAGFDYDALLFEVNDAALMKQRFALTSIGYEKMQLFRIIQGQHEDHVIAKFINESYHIENEYIMQLNPHRFEGVPEYIIEECNRLLA